MLTSCLPVHVVRPQASVGRLASKDAGPPQRAIELGGLRSRQAAHLLRRLVRAEPGVCGQPSALRAAARSGWWLAGACLMRVSVRVCARPRRDNKICSTDTNSWQTLNTVEGQHGNDKIYGFSLSADGALLATGCERCRPRMRLRLLPWPLPFEGAWSAEMLRRLWSWRSPNARACLPQLS